jgi:uncharacterized membrane protein YphA (DoxX/SURF4 family)
VAVPLILGGVSGLRGHVEPAILQWLAVAAGALLFAGWLTPIAGGLLAGAQLWITFAAPGQAEAHLLLGAVSAGLAMLGPGAWSIDARQFGRKRIEIADH